MRYYIPAVIYISFVSIRRNGHTNILQTVPVLTPGPPACLKEREGTAGLIWCPAMPLPMWVWAGNRLMENTRK